MLLVLAAWSNPAAALQPHVRDGWILGFSYGYTKGHIDWSGEAQGAYEGGALPQMRFARMVSDHLALGLEYHGWMLEDGEVPLKLRSSLQSINLAATWYPGNPGSVLQGFYVRGGVGYGWAGLTEIEIDAIPQDYVPLYQEHGERTDESALAFNLGVGYEFRVTHNFAAGLGLGFDYLNVDKNIYKSAYYLPLTLTLGWYWN